MNEIQLSDLAHEIQLIVEEKVLNFKGVKVSIDKQDCLYNYLKNQIKDYATNRQLNEDTVMNEIIKIIEYVKQFNIELRETYNEDIIKYMVKESIDYYYVCVGEDER